MPNDEPDRLLKQRKVVDLVGFSRPTIYKKIADGKFPRPVKIGRASRWSERAISAWIEEQKAR